MDMIASTGYKLFNKLYEESIKITPIFILKTIIFLYLGFYYPEIFCFVVNLFSFIIGISIFLIASNRYSIDSNKLVLILGIGYGCISLFILINVFSYLNIDFNMLNFNHYMEISLVISFFEGITFLLCSLLSNRKIKINIIILFYFLVSLLGFLSIFKWDVLLNFIKEETYYISSYTVIELIITLIFITSINVMENKKLKSKVNPMILVFLVLKTTEHFMFALIGDLDVSFGVTGHFIQFISYYILYKAIVKSSLKKIYGNLAYSTDKLDDSTINRIEAEKKLMMEKNILNSILDSTADGILVTGTDGKIIYSNNNLANMWQISKELLDNNNLEDLIKVVKNQIKNPDRFMARVRKITKFKKEENNGFIHFKDGRIFEYLFKPLRINGKVSGNIYSFRDITRREKVIDALKESKRRYKTLVETIPDGIGVIRDGKYIYANRALADILNVSSPEDIIGRSEREFSRVHPDYETIVNKRVGDIVNNGRTVSFLEQKIVRRDGTIFDAEVAGFPFSNKDNSSVVAVIRDITERKEAEKLQRQVEIKEKLLEEAKKYDKLKTEFLSIISHELKTPLNIILGGIQLLDKRNREYERYNDYEDSSKYVKMMKKNCYRLLRMINNLIDIAELDSDYAGMNFKNYDIVSVIEDITLSVAEYLKDKGISVIFDTDIEEKIIACDVEKLQKVMLNLLSNAVKFMDSHGTIEVRLFDKGQSVIISVKDSGVGIPEDMLDIVFDRFRQVDSSLKRKNEGSGIGLAIVKSIIERHRGSISVKSKQGMGSEFIIELPAWLIDDEDVMHGEEEISREEQIEKINIEFSDIFSL